MWVEVDIQYSGIQTWKCKKCGAVLQAKKGLHRHAQRCEYTQPVLEGQITIDEVIDSEEEAIKAQ